VKSSNLEELVSKKLITENQFNILEPIIARKVLSVFYELRILLYLGVLLFTTGMGLLIYMNIGDLGHLFSIIVIFVLTGVCFWYSFKHAPDYSHEKVEPITPFFDYIVLLGCLLFISSLTYLQFQYNIFDDGLGATTLVTAVFFFFAAYRFDHLGILSLGIAALASFWGIAISPQKWYNSNFFSESGLHNIALIFSASLAIVAAVLDRKKIKQHFTFTYLNYSILIYLIAALSGMFINDDYYFIYLIVLYAGCAVAAFIANKQHSFLFLLYAFVFGYIGTTYLLADIILDDPAIWFLYLIASCGGFVYFIIRYKNYFKRA
jgi:hypothetical protein